MVVACLDKAAQGDASTVKLESFKKQAYDYAKTISNQFGGPGHYLAEVLAYPALVNDFAWHLWTYFPEMDDTTQPITTPSAWSPLLKKIGPTPTHAACV